MYICVCKAVTDGAIQGAIDRGADSVRDLSRELGCGTGCGKCVPEVRAMLNGTHGCLSQASASAQPWQVTKHVSNADLLPACA